VLFVLLEKARVSSISRGAERDRISPGKIPAVITARKMNTKYTVAPFCEGDNSVAASLCQSCWI